MVNINQLCTAANCSVPYCYRQSLNLFLKIFNNRSMAQLYGIVSFNVDIEHHLKGL